MSGAPVAVIGLGHALLGDNGVGLAVVHALEHDYVVTDALAIVDAGRCGRDLGRYLLDHERLIFVDALILPAPPGTVHTLSYRQLMAAQPSGPRIASHQPAIHEALALGNLAGRGPLDVLLVGIVPESLEVGVELSPSAYAAVPRALDEVVRHLWRFGVVLARRHETQRATG